MVLGFGNQVTEGRKGYHQRFLSISKLHASLYQLQLWAYHHLYRLPSPSWQNPTQSQNSASVASPDLAHMPVTGLDIGHGGPAYTQAPGIDGGGRWCLRGKRRRYCQKEKERLGVGKNNSLLYFTNIMQKLSIGGKE